MLGTKWPSMMSRCSQSAPAAAIASTSSPSLEKSAASRLGATSTPSGGQAASRSDSPLDMEPVLASVRPSWNHRCADQEGARGNEGLIPCLADRDPWYRV